jgi:E3 ubiquitin-protein ligase MYCBP2
LGGNGLGGTLQGQVSEYSLHSSKALQELVARRTVLSVVSSIIQAACQILSEASSIIPNHTEIDEESKPINESLCFIVDHAHIFSTLLPLVLAHLGPVASQDARAAVQVLNMVQVNAMVRRTMLEYDIDNINIIY